MAELKLQQSRLDGRYDILECLGRGSYAEIYVANDNAAPEGAPRTTTPHPKERREQSSSKR